MRINFKKLYNKAQKVLSFREVSGSATQITNTNLANFQVKHVGFNSDSTDYSEPENDLEEVKSAIQTDSYIKVALDKTSQLIFKAGYKITGNNEAAVEYLEQRIRLMEFGTGIPFDILLQEMGRDLVYYSNAFWIKSRVDSIQGIQNIKPVLADKPVGGYFRADPTAISISRDNDGAISGYQITGNDEEEFDASEVVHFYIDRDAENNFGTPRIISALEDVQILRKIEGNTLSLIYRFAMPLYHMKIGLPQQNFMATDQEISEAQDQMNSMPLDGIIITNERTSFEAIGSDGEAIELGDYLSYFENRTFTALNVSQAMMGRGGTKQDADSMEGLMHDTVKYYQRNISAFIEKNVFNELLLEGGYNPIFNTDDQVKFEFNEINLDTKVKQENHYINEYQGNAITFEEMRRAIGRKADGTDESRLYTNMITTQSEIDVLNAKVSAENATGNGNLSNGSGQSSKTPNGAVSSTSNPTNQHGTTSAKMKEDVNVQEADRSLAATMKTEQNNIRFENEYSQMYKLFEDMRNDISKKENFSKTNITKYSREFIKEFNDIIDTNAALGYAKVVMSLKDFEKSFSVKKHVSNEVKELAKKQVNKFIEDLAAKVNSHERNTLDCFDFMKYRLRFMSDYLSKKSYWTTVVIAYKEQGYKKLNIKFSDNSNHEKEYDKVIKTDNFKINQIPPFSPYCKCEIEKPEGK